MKVEIQARNTKHLKIKWIIRIDCEKLYSLELNVIYSTYLKVVL
jgi:hypothetical protein